MPSPVRFRFELPLLKRELIELAQRKRTYALRCVCLTIFSLVFLFLYAAIRADAVNLMAVLGRGRDITQILFFTLMVTIYALAPAMSCSAITSEKEKQTLGLLLMSKLSPFGIVVEKMFSRMVPLMSLVIVSSPLFGLAYLFGGLSFSESLLGIGCLLYVVFQVTAVAVFCSALVETGIAAFWLTYAILLAMYFTLPILVEMDVLPRMGGPNVREAEFLFFPFYQVVMLMEVNRTAGSVFLLTIPSLILTLCFPVAAWLALKRFAYGSATSFRIILLRLQGMLAKPMARLLPRGPLKQQAKQAVIDADSPLPTRMSTDFPERNPLRWREVRSTAILKLRPQLMLVGAFFLLQFWVLNSARSGNYHVFCAMFSFSVLIICLLIVLSLASKLFTKERERQTFDSLLVVPMTNRGIVSEKIVGLNRLILLLLIPMVVTGLFNVFFAPMRISTLTATAADGNNTGYYYGGRIADGFDWFAASLVYLGCVLGNALIYMHLVKWIAVYFSLRVNTHMKAMIGSLVSVLMLCLVPMILLALLLISVDADPDDFPLWFFSSPAIVVAVNEFHDLRMLFRSSFLPDSDVFVILCNFIVFGGLTMVVRAYVLRKLQDLLQRRDQTSAPTRNSDVDETAWLN